MDLPKSERIERQVKKFRKDLSINGEFTVKVVIVRYDDRCGNGHNTFSITMDGGCQHDEIREYFPELAYLIKWHLVGSDEPMYYKENSAYWRDKGNKEHTAETIVFGAVESDKEKEDFMSMTNEEFIQFLNNRLPELMNKFKKDIEGLGFTY